MPLQFCTQLTSADQRLLGRALHGFLPDRIYDIHAHLTHTRHFAAGTRPVFLEEDRAYGLRCFQEAMAQCMPGRTVEGLFFGYPCRGNDRDGENAWLREEIAAAAVSCSRGLLLAAPADDPCEVGRRLEDPIFVGIKPYRLYAEMEDTREAAVESFAPEWMWQLCHDRDGVLMLHLMRCGGITDADNLAVIRRLGGRYPRCRLVLAHVARAFNYRQAREGLQVLADLDNVVLDTAAVTQAGAFRAALEILGPRRLLWGSDYMVSQLRGACFTQGDGFTWVYADDASAKDLTVFGSYTLVGIESLLCLREACDDTGLTPADVADIFRGNALRLLAPHLPAGAVPAEPAGPELTCRARQSISCQTGLQSKRAESFDPATWPAYFSRASGSYVWDMGGRRYVDFTGGVGAILLGHGDPDVNAAVRRRVTLGSYCTLASPDEITLAETLLELHPWAGKVRYARGGGEALALAVRIARAATGRSGIAFCGYHGWSDWYLAANLAGTTALEGHLMPGLEPRGVPRELTGTAVPFKYNDLATFEQAFDRLGGAPAAVLMEPMRSEEPREGFLHKIAARCRAAGAVFMIDEVTAGWRFGFPGGSARLGIEPDVAVYAKAMSNGFPCAAIVGREAVMEAAAGSFISSSYWTDGVGPAAALACIGKMRRLGTQARVWSLGQRLQHGLRQLAAAHPHLGIAVGGQPAAPSLALGLGSDSGAAKVLYIRHMLARGYLVFGQYYVLGTHDEAQIDTLLAALEDVFTALDTLQADGRLQAAAGDVKINQGFGRLA
jgi:glutamate-1-semialdehyde 2,1-aminomutase